MIAMPQGGLSVTTDTRPYKSNEIFSETVSILRK